MLICYEYRNTKHSYVKTYILYRLNDHIRAIDPIDIRISRSGTHGEECYTSKAVDNSIAILHVYVTTRNNHRCTLKINKELDQLTRLKLAKTVLSIHKCINIIHDLLSYYPELEELIT